MLDTTPPNEAVNAERRTVPQLVEQVRAELTALSPAERRVAERVLRDPAEVIHRSVTELAAAADTSPATVVRFCVSLGLRGFQELKIRLAAETIPQAQRMLGEIVPGDGPTEIAHKVIDGTAGALTQASASVDTEVLEEIAGLILGARRVFFGAVGTSAPLAADMSYRLLTIGIDAVFCPDVHTQHVGARMLGSEDVFFAISHTGSTFETLAAARAARAASAKIVAITSFSRSPLTEIADLVLVAGSAETAYRVEAMASRIVHLTVLDALFVVLSMRSTAAAAALAAAEDVLVEHRL